MNKGSNTHLLGLELQELARLTEETDEPSYRARQLFHALYTERAHSIDEVSTLSKDFRSRLKTEGFTLGLPEIAKKFASTDGTVRYLLRLADAETVEAVWMPEGDDGETGDGSEAAFDLGLLRLFLAAQRAGGVPPASETDEQDADAHHPERVLFDVRQLSFELVHG